MSSITIVETFNPNKSTAISIRPYFDDAKENMGLEKYGQSLFDGASHMEQLACLEMNGIKRYITGLNEFAPEIKLIADKDVREAKIKQIRIAVTELEKELAANILDPEDPQFWNNVKLLRPDNSDFWNRIEIRCGNQPVFLDPAKDSYDRIKLHAIEAGGFDMIAKSLESAKAMPKPIKFYLDKMEDTISTKTELKKIRNKALSSLQELFDKNTKKLWLVAKVVDANSAQYKKSTSNDLVYDNMDKFINGEGIEKHKLKAASKFNEVVDIDMGTLKMRALVKDATYYKAIATKGDGYIYHLESSVLLGRNPADVVEYLKNPLHEDTLSAITRVVEMYWNQ